MFNLDKLPKLTRQTIEGDAKLRALFKKLPTRLLEVNNAKTVKGESLGYLTGVMYLAPADASGIVMCAMAETAKCKAPCLFTAGRGVMSNVMYPRLRKTLAFQQHRDWFMVLLRNEVARLERRATRLGLKLAVRLNGTSDVRWENELIDGKSIMEWFPNVQFYDYTKLPNRRNLPKNYDLTFSASAAPGFGRYMVQAAASGMRLAYVLRTPERVAHFVNVAGTLAGFPAVDGDEHDLRFLNPQGVAVLLYAKGRAKNDTAGLVFDL